MNAKEIDEHKHIIHIALTPWDLADEYNRHCGVLMISILENTNSSIIFHILYDDRLSQKNLKLAEETYNNFQEICRSYNAKIEFHPVHVDERLSTLPAIKIYTVGSLLRIYLPEVLSEIDKVLYLDIDIVVTLDIEELWAYNITDYLLAARIITRLPRKRKRDYWELNIDPEIYFNSGVLLLNLEKIRNEINLPKSVEEYLLNHPNLGWPDQDVLNFFLQNSFLPLPKKYNYPACGVDISDDNQNSILHFAGREKPWKIYFGGLDEYYWSYFILTPWACDAKKLIGYVRMAPNVQANILCISDWISLSFPRGQMKKVWIILKLAIFEVLKRDILHLYYYVLRGENYVPKNE